MVKWPLALLTVPGAPGSSSLYSDTYAPATGSFPLLTVPPNKTAGVSLMSIGCEPPRIMPTPTSFGARAKIARQVGGAWATEYVPPSSLSASGQPPTKTTAWGTGVEPSAARTRPLTAWPFESVTSAVGLRRDEDSGELNVPSNTA